MTITTIPFEPSKHLDDDEAIAAYLDAAFEDGDPAIIAVALGNVAKAKGMTQIARDAGATREALYKALSERGDPRLTTLLGVMRALGVRLSAHVAERRDDDRAA